MLVSAGYSGHSSQQIVSTSPHLVSVLILLVVAGDTRSSNDSISADISAGSVSSWPLAPYLQSWLRGIWDKAEIVRRQLDTANK